MALTGKVLMRAASKSGEVAATYERYAKACEFSWPRTAAALLRVAQSYLDMAEREDAEARMRK